MCEPIYPAPPVTKIRKIAASKPEYNSKISISLMTACLGAHRPCSLRLLPIAENAACNGLVAFFWQHLASAYQEKHVFLHIRCVIIQKGQQGRTIYSSQCCPFGIKDYNRWSGHQCIRRPSGVFIKQLAAQFSLWH